MNAKSFEVTGGVLKSVEEVDDGWTLHIDPRENDVEVHVMKGNGSNCVRKSAAVKYYRAKTGHWPNLHQIETINEQVDDLERWKATLDRYLLAGRWPKQVATILDWYHGKVRVSKERVKKEEKVEPLSHMFR